MDTNYTLQVIIFETLFSFADCLQLVTSVVGIAVGVLGYGLIDCALMLNNSDFSS